MQRLGYKKDIADVLIAVYYCGSFLTNDVTEKLHRKHCVLFFVASGYMSRAAFAAILPFDCASAGHHATTCDTLNAPINCALLYCSQSLLFFMPQELF